VARARSAQLARYAALPGIVANGRVPGRWLARETPVDAAARELLANAAERLGLSARGYHRVLRVARTIADLDGASRIDASCVAEALRYRAPLARDGVTAVAGAA
jgi:magnesium chelatase family protein